MPQHFYATMPDHEPRATQVERRSVAPLAILLSSLTLWAAAIAFPSWIWPAASVGTFAWLVIYGFRSHRQAMAFCLPVLILHGSVLSSLLFVSSGVLMPELGIKGSADSAAPAFLTYSAIFILSYLAAFPMWARGFALHESSLRWSLAQFRAASTLLVLFSAGAIFVLLMARGLQTGFPLLDHVDRYFFRQHVADNLVVQALNLKNVASAALGILFFSSPSTKANRLAAVVLLVSLNLIYVLYGDKFFTILIELSFFLMPGMLKTNVQWRHIWRKYGLVGAALLISAFALTFYVYTGYGRLSAEDAWQSLAGRIAGQGQIWYMANRDGYPLWQLDTSLLSSYASSLTSHEPAFYEFREGLATYHFAYRYSPSWLVTALQNNAGHTQFTMGFEAMGLTIFGYAGLVPLMILAALLLAFLAAYLNRAFSLESPVHAALAAWLMTFAISTLNLASLWQLFGVLQLRMFLVVLVFEIGLIFVATSAAPPAPRPSLRNRS